MASESDLRVGTGQFETAVTFFQLCCGTRADKKYAV